MRGKYVSVERVTEQAGGAEVDWRMATSSDAGGAFQQPSRVVCATLMLVVKATFLDSSQTLLCLAALPKTCPRFSRGWKRSSQVQKAGQSRPSQQNELALRL